MNTNKKRWADSSDLCSWSEELKTQNSKAPSLKQTFNLLVLFSLFNGFSTFVIYLMTKPSLYKNNSSNI